MNFNVLSFFVSLICPLMILRNGTDTTDGLTGDERRGMRVLHAERLIRAHVTHEQTINDILIFFDTICPYLAELLDYHCYRLLATYNYFIARKFVLTHSVELVPLLHRLFDIQYIHLHDIRNASIRHNEEDNTLLYHEKRYHTNYKGVYVSRCSSRFITMLNIYIYASRIGIQPNSAIRTSMLLLFSLIYEKI